MVKRKPQASSSTEFDTETDMNEGDSYMSAHAESDSDSEQEQENVTVVVPSLIVPPESSGCTFSNLNGKAKLKVTKPVPQAQRRSQRLINKRHTQMTPQDENLEFETHVNQESGDSPGLYRMLTKAFQDMTSQVINAIQTTFKSMSGTQNVHTSSSVTRSEVKQSRARRNDSRSHSGYTRTVYSESTESSSENDSEDTDSDISHSSLGKVITRPNKSENSYGTKLPAFTGKEKWEVWLNRFEAVAQINNLSEKEKLKELLPRLQGEAGDFAFDQLPQKTLGNYRKLVNEMNARFGIIESRRTYRLQFSRRKQLFGESPEKFAAELKRLYDKAYKHRDVETRQEDLLQKFLLGLLDYKARIHIELNRDPNTIEEAVYEVLNYTETLKNPNQTEDGKRSSVRQVKKNVKTGNEKNANFTSKGTDESYFDKKPTNQQGGPAEAENQLIINRQELESLIKEIVTSQQKESSQIPHMSRFNQGYLPKSGYQNQNCSKGRTLVCFNCGQPGHIARNCLGPKKHVRPQSENKPDEFLPKPIEKLGQNGNYGNGVVSGLN